MTRKIIIAVLLSLLIALGVYGAIQATKSRTKAITRTGSIKINQKLRP
ncbi:hypothetical protein P1X15_10790 [Runella sp. MFBS21]|nr:MULTISPECIES: hypothetical protein [Runella]MDF7818086.1 hypothetical protein [Runella sp. MFBS21]